MKKIVVFLLLLVCVSQLSAQDLPVDIKTGKVTYMEVVEADGMSAKELYSVLKEWALANGLKIKEEKEAGGEIYFDGVLPMEYERIKGRNEACKVNYEAYLMVKEGKYRYIFTDFVQVASESSLTGGKLENVTPDCGYSGINSGNWNKIKHTTASTMEKLVYDLKKKVKEVQNDPLRNKDW